MHMRMVGQCRAPGVKHRGDADASAEVLGVGRDGDHGLGRGREQDVVDHGLVLIGNVRNGGRQREHHMEVPNRKQVGLARGETLRSCGTLALWAMPVAATNGQRPLPALWAKFVMVSWPPEASD